METMVKSDSFVSLTENEIIQLDGGGKVTLFLSMIGIAASPAVACVCPAGGAALFLSSGGAFLNNM